LITRFFYSKLAGDKSFSAKEFSLLHSDFDRDSDIAASSSNSFSITNPQIVYDVFSWIVLGSRHYNKLNLYQISREHFKNNITQFDEIFGNDFPSSENIKEDDALNTRKIIVVDSKRNEIFEKEYNDNLHEVIYNIYNKFTLFNKHYQASEIIQSWYEGSHENIAPMNTYQRIAWKEIFSGGEGLYYTFRNKDIKPTPSINNYICAIDEIESELESIRAKYFPLNTLKEVNAAFISVKSKAFQIGLFMALDIFRESDKFIDKYEDFITKLNTIKLNNWIYIFNVIRPKLIRGTSPKDWPTYQKLILRIIQGSEQNYYTVDNYIDSPDYIIFEKDIEEAFNAWWKENEDDINEDLFMYKTIEEQIKTWATKTKESVEKLMRDGEIELILFDNHDAEKLASEIVIKLGKKINPSFA